MAASRDLVLAKARATLSALSGLTPTEREGKPTAAFMDDYNRLRRAFLEVMPAAESLAPPEAEEDALAWFATPNCTYGELLAYHEQIIAFLDQSK